MKVSVTVGKRDSRTPTAARAEFLGVPRGSSEFLGVEGAGSPPRNPEEPEELRGTS
jgi:hypothetical protein